MMIAPAAVSRSTTVASYGGLQPSRIFDEHVVGTPRVHMLSFERDGDTGERAGSSLASGVDPGGRGAGLVGQHVVAGVQLGFARVDRGEVVLDYVALP